MNAKNPRFSITMSLVENYKFLIDFGDAGTLYTDEPAPLGGNEGPNPSRLLAASVANCLAASLLFAIRKFKEDPGQLSAQVSGDLVRQDGRWRITHIDVDLTLNSSVEDLSHLPRALAQFEDFCVVTQSVRHGVDINVNVLDSLGNTLHSS